MGNFDIKNLTGTPLAIAAIVTLLILGIFGISFAFKGSVQV